MVPSEMKRIPTVVLAISLLPFGTARSDEEESSDDLLARIEMVPDGKSGLNESEQSYIEEVLKHEKEAIPRLVAELSNPDENVAEIAAAALADCTHIDEKYLPQIIIGLDRGIGWLPSALGKIENALAAKESVKRYLSADSSPHNQEANAVRNQGSRAIPFIIQAASTNGGKDSKVYGLLGYVLGEMESADRKNAAAALLLILDDGRASDDFLSGILTLIGHLEEDGLGVEEKLEELRKSRPVLGKDIDRALIGIHSSQSGRIYAGILRENPDHLVLRDISEVGEPANDAGEEVAKLLNHTDWEIRRAAARTIGFIGYEEAIPKLISLLDDPGDVVINRISAESLGRLHAKSAEDALTKTAATHWHPFVRATAETALSHVRSSKPYELKFHPDNFAFEFFDFDHFQTENTPPDTHAGIVEPLELKIYRSTGPERVFEKLSYPSEIVSYGANDEEEQRDAKGEDGIIEVHEGNIQENREPITQTPNVALRVDGGWLGGSSRGEWGGELVFLADDGTHQYVNHENTSDLFTLGTKRVAVGGLAHLTMNSGMIYELTRGADSKWKATPWRALPGAPGSSEKTESGKILISTYGGGDVVLSEDGSFRMAAD